MPRWRGGEGALARLDVSGQGHPGGANVRAVDAEMPRCRRFSRGWLGGGKGAWRMRMPPAAALRWGCLDVRRAAVGAAFSRRGNQAHARRRRRVKAAVEVLAARCLLGATAVREGCGGPSQCRPMCAMPLPVLVLSARGSRRPRVQAEAEKVCPDTPTRDGWFATAP